MFMCAAWWRAVVWDCIPVLRIPTRPACARRSGGLFSPAASHCYNSCAVLLVVYTTNNKMSIMKICV